MRFQSTFATAISIIVAHVLLPGCSSSDGSIRDIDFDFGFDLGTTYIAESVTATGTVDGTPLPSAAVTDQWLLQSSDQSIDVLLISLKDDSGMERAFAVRLREDFRITGDAHSFASNVSMHCTSIEDSCPVDILGPDPTSDAETETTTSASLSSEPLEGDKVRFHIVAHTTGGDDVDVVLVAPVDEAGRLVRE